MNNYNLLDMGGFWSGYTDGTTQVQTDFAVGEFPLSITHKRINTNASVCNDPFINLKTGALFETSKEGDNVTIVHMFPTWTSSVGVTSFDLDIVGVEKDDGLSRRFEISYNPSTNEMSVTTKSSGFYGLGAFSELFSDYGVTNITDNSGTIIGVTITGCLLTAISNFHLSQHSESESGKFSSCQSSVTFASYDDLQITVGSATEEPDEPDEPTTAPADLYKIKNGVGQTHDTYKRVGDQWVPLDEYNV